MPRYHLLLVIIGLAVAISSAATAEELSAEETEALLFEGPWEIEAGATFNYFQWEPDGTLCVKMFDPQAAKCDDTGSWTRNETIVCYQLQWWGKTYDEHQGCFEIVETEPGSYETFDAGGLPGLKFTIVATI